MVVYVKRGAVSRYQKAIEMLSARNSPQLCQDI